MFISGHFLGMWKRSKLISCSKVGLDLQKWLRVKKEVEWKLLSQKLRSKSPGIKIPKITLGTNIYLVDWAPSRVCWVPFPRKKRHRKNVKFHLTRHWLELANQWLEVTRQILWRDSYSIRPSHNSTLIRIEKILDDSHSTAARMASGSDSTLT